MCYRKKCTQAQRWLLQHSAYDPNSVQLKAAAQEWQEAQTQQLPLKHNLGMFTSYVTAFYTLCISDKYPMLAIRKNKDQFLKTWYYGGEEEVIFLACIKSKLSLKKKKTLKYTEHGDACLLSQQLGSWGKRHISFRPEKTSASQSKNKPSQSRKACRIFLSPLLDNDFCVMGLRKNY